MINKFFAGKYMDFNSIADYLLAYAYYYPLFMSYLWICGGLYYRYHWESGNNRYYNNPPELDQYPSVSILIPCHNEADNIEETILYAFQQKYPDFDVIAVNDGSEDDTADILNRLQQQHTKLRVVHLKHNRGKATALNIGAMLSTNEFLVCIDSDAVLDPHACNWMMSHFINSPRVAAVTGNPRIRNRSSLLGKIQVGEFSSIIGLIKRAQRIYGRVFTVSGVVTAFRKSALHKVGYWNTHIITEDIEISWKLQIDHWDIRYEPNALCWILMPETYGGLWQQRLRWARGGLETTLTHISSLFHWRKRRMWPVVTEYLCSVLWSYIVGVILVLWALGKFITLPEQYAVPSIIPGWNGVVLATTCLLQFLISLIIDSRYEKGLWKNFFWMVWYPLAYWMINTLTIIVAVPTTLLGKGKTGKWTSPDRGIRNET
ncbi:MAG: biofilm PGA synthesis N-glycosyltransferase PgaC [Pseudohongiellaceae bacterium]